ncbi:HDOD domain-containing protein [Hydrocarboniclastica marina]|uniref:HDOD domain-containing protein n=1 Tax=Hydrocarboniclastica marina TaxID=2259620 RepID=A0A4P7XFR6_9ALTE|nr:HDOD domain-containing protein [Hydrocarboniclastica marina]MAL99742.1 histidine kinase [Alteromonadaceae bacterium]QCF25284.1 HDOD domain-containing protein [Hydrocarboniclastica marina]|tara:strand:+ start:693 stop:1547 length:855 start_codon:yes stop_codon:yes gene_type:complete
MADLAERIRNDLITAINNDKLVLPTLPEVAIRVREIAEAPDSAILDLVREISDDASLSARIIRICNSPLFRGSREIDSLNMAISRLGMAYTSNLAMGLAMEQMFQATSDMVDKRLRATWQRSTEIAGISHVLAQHYTKLRPDQATLAGLTHQIGVLPVLRYVEDNDIQISSVMLDNLIDEIHPRVGAHILQRWDFPKDLQQVPVEYLNLTRQVPRVDYADIVMVATLQSRSGDAPAEAGGRVDGDVDWGSISAFERLGLDPNKNLGEEEDLNAQMEAAMALLNQ